MLLFKALKLFHDFAYRIKFVTSRNAICIFYLVLRALDTVEDDMTIPLDIKVPMLKTFYTHLDDTQWSYNDSKEKDRIVLEDFTAVSTFIV